MPDIFLSYASEDVDIAKKVYDLLDPLWDVVWDHAASGSYIEFVEANVPVSGCMVVLLSPKSCRKKTVLRELHLADRHDVTVIPVIIAACDIPYICNTDMLVDLDGWSGDNQSPGWFQLLAKLDRVVQRREKPQRLKAILGGAVGLPCLFHSISSYETRIDPLAALQVVEFARRKSRQVPYLLLSAYDTWRLWAQARLRSSGRATKQAQDDWRAMVEYLRAYRDNGGIVLLDSGNYEAGRLNDDSWCRRRLHRALRETPHDLAFCFDRLEPPRDPQKNAEQVVSGVQRDSVWTEAPMLPIVHVPRARKGAGTEYLREQAPQVVREVAQQLKPPMIAIPERELGSGIAERVDTMSRIRECLSSLEFYQPVHILGTGDPWVIATLSAAGADSFDGLEWCRFVADYDSNSLRHFHHLDFFMFQSRRDGATDGLDAHVALAAEAHNDENIRYSGRVALHNLAFYTGFMKKVQYWASAGNFPSLLNVTIKGGSQEEIPRIVPEQFK